MNGIENGGYEGENNNGAENAESEPVTKMEMSDVTVGFETADSTKKNNENFIVRWNLKTRARLKEVFFGKTQMSRIFWIVFLNGAAAGLLVVSVTERINNDLPPVNWCDGVGFLWILYFLVYLNIAYYIVKKFFGNQFVIIFKPVEKFFAFLGDKRYFRIFCYLAPILGLAAYVIFNPGKTGRRLISFLGMTAFIAFGYLFSKHPGHVKWRTVICGMALQFVFGLLTIQIQLGKDILECLGNKVTNFLAYTEEGARFIYGPLAGNDPVSIFAFSVLPVIFFLSFFINLLSYYGALQWIVMKISWVVKISMGTTVCESVNGAASIFLGMTESPLLIRSYLKDLTKSEICAVLCSGWSTVAGVVMAAYIKHGIKASHLIAASVMSAPASLAYSKLFYPETEESKNTIHNIKLEKEKAANVLDAASKGAINAITLVGSITANIIAFLAFISFLDGTLGWIGAVVGFKELSFQWIMSKIFYPISYLMGIEDDMVEDVAYLIGIKTVANEFQAYKMLGELLKQNKLSERSEIIATYALCGFSNLGSIGITVGTLSAIEPKQRATVTEVALRAFIAANFVCFLTACVAGCLIE